ncbi:Aste57867_21601 [Aphanomyces stellatus]|uniref:Aste57867_21601 protein n=1 Tax=Aphanomyces stellatus TaxID=120398 RepID=A0A485LHZ2_9STRA|nr:hypothetical protein As57867_021532 [Aphanomyces stellatus]VFT98271.1 Aste57867_21601 [Aphanomyces stellatus]
MSSPGGGGDDGDDPLAAMLMPDYRKRKFFLDLDKIYPLPKSSGAMKLDPFDEIMAGAPQFASIRAWMEESRRETEEDNPGARKDLPPAPSPSLSRRGSVTTDAAQLSPTPRLDDDIVPETIEASDKFEIVSETKGNVHSSADPAVDPSTSIIEGNQDDGLTSTHESTVMLWDTSETQLSLDDGSVVVPSISFHAEDSREVLEDSHANDSFAAFPVLPPSPQSPREESPTPPTQRQPAPATTSLSSDPSTTTLRPLSPSPLNPVVDYFDADSFAELVPCWFFDAPCRFHDAHLQHPHLLFYIQALDVFLASASSTRSVYFYTACLVARRLFVNLWHTKPSTALDLPHFLDRGNTLPGVCTTVWRFLAAEWRRRHPMLHHTPSVFATSSSQPPPLELTAETATLSALAARLVYGNRHALAPHYLVAVAPTMRCAVALHARAVVSCDDMQLALRSLQSHLKCPVFAMGTLRRGGIFVSVLDVLAISSATMWDLVTLLQHAKVLESDAMDVTSTRLVAPIRFKGHRLLLDLKVYTQPMASFAMLYFTGPRTYVASVVLPPAAASWTFDAWADWLTRRFGAALQHVTDEASACHVLQIPHKAPKNRLC